nr:MAG TPA: hypothetical protein [Caudoviricetes sp.]
MVRSIVVRFTTSIPETAKLEVKSEVVVPALSSATI